MKWLYLAGVVFMAVPPMRTVQAGEAYDHIASVVLSALMGAMFYRSKP